MKKSFLVLAFLISSVTALAQAQLEEKAIQLNLQAGTGGTGIVFLGADYGIKNRFSAGLEASYRKHSAWGQPTGFRIAGVGNWKVNKHDKFGVYLGVLLGYDFYQANKKEEAKMSIKFSDDNGTHALTGPAFGGHLGLRYFFTDKFGAYLQIGAGNYVEGRVGITYKL